MAGKFLTQEHMYKWLIEDGRGIIQLSPYVSSKTPSLYQCQNNHQWTSTPNIIKSGRGCPECYARKRSSSKESMNDWLSEDGRGIIQLGEYHNKRTASLFQCKYGHQWETQPGHVKKGSGCPICSPTGFSPDKPAWTYVIKFETFIKYGITNNLNSRMGTHKRKNGPFELAYSVYNEDGQLALEWENRVKKTHGGRYVTKEQCPDGYTETLPINLLVSIQMIQHS